ncbi:MAG: hypothetical protein HPY71_06170 [Firmicutes bacterium]|nr:hypothetical protein [Bacillota bacterium]
MFRALGLVDTMNFLDCTKGIMQPGPPAGSVGIGIGRFPLNRPGEQHGACPPGRDCGAEVRDLN